MISEQKQKASKPAKKRTSLSKKKSSKKKVSRKKSAGKKKAGAGAEKSRTAKKASSKKAGKRAAKKVVPIAPIAAFGARARHWLMKSEPEVYSIDDLEREGKTQWEGVRNYQARNFMRDNMEVGDLVLFYHSNAKPPGIAGIGRVCSKPYADFTAWDRKSKYFDAKTDPDSPTWMMVDVEFVERFAAVISLDALRDDPALEDMLVIRRGQRLSIQPVEEAHFRHIQRLGRKSRK